EGLTFTIQPGEGYTVDESANSISLTLLDAESTAPEPPPEEPPVPVDPIPSDNTPPVAENDSYTTAEGTELTVDVDAGILANDSDAEGNQLIVSILETPGDGNLSLSEDGSFSYTPNDGFSGTDTFTYLVNDGEIFSEPATVEITVEAASEPEPPTETPTEPSTGELPVVSFEVVPSNFSEEAEDNLVEWKWTVEGEFPEEGITVNLDTSGGNPDIPFDFTNQFAASPEAEFVNAEIVDFDDTGRLNILLSEPEASFQLYFINDIIEEGTQPFDFELVEGEGYTVDPNQNSTNFTITDDNGGPGVGPTVGLSVSETDLAEGDEFTVNFNADGEIPEDGVQILVESSVPGALGQFDLSDLSTLELDGIVGLPEVGDGGGGSFLVTIAEPTASITTSVFDDIIAEEPLELPFTIVNGEEYEVDADAGSVTINVVDETQPAGPTVGISIDQTDVVEGDSITLTLNVDGEIPAEGLTVLVNDTNSAQNQLRSLTEFNIAQIEFTGLSEFPRPADGDSGFFVTITEPTATITVPIIDDDADEVEADESFTFEVIDGEAYQVDSENGAVTLNISDASDSTTEPPTGDVPVVSASIEPNVVSEEDEEPSLTLTFTVDGEIPTPELDADGAVISGGLPVLFDGTDVNPLFEQITGGPIIEGFALGEFSDPEQPDLLEFVLLENTSSVTLNIFNDVIQEEPQDLTFGILPDDEGLLDSNYTVDPDAASDTVTLIDDNGGAGVGPTVGLSISETELREGDEFTVNFNVDGEIPEGGLTVLVDSETPRVLGEFNLFDADGNPAFTASGIEGVPELGDSGASSFLATITEPDASITLSIFDDGANEGLEEISFSLVDGEIYELDADAQQVSFSIDDSLVPVFGSIDGDVIEVKGSSQLVFGGDESDLIDASIGSEGSNRIYAGSGDDTVILGMSDRIVGGEGADKFFATTGGDNTITGGAGADQFWIATAEIPDAANIITDFTSGEDVLGIAGLGIGFDDLSITQQDDNTLIAADNSELAILQGIGADSLMADNFAFA
ncbi:MAG: Ig-like domain-containing protein, partial [Cyanobacteria bacterium P01_D01_bin.116]